MNGSQNRHNAIVVTRGRTFRFALDNGQLLIQIKG